MYNNYRIFFKDKFLVWGYIVTVLLNFLLFIFTYLKINELTDTIILRYTASMGVDAMGEWYKVFILALLGSIIILINFTLSYIIIDKEKLLSYILMLSSLACQLLLGMALYFIISINT